VLEIDASQVNADSGVHNTANWDSLASINIVLEVEKLAGRPLDLLELARVKTAADLVEIVCNAAAGIDQ
jgi:acyl carrier protein